MANSSQTHNGSHLASTNGQEPQQANDEDLNPIKDGYVHYQRIRVVRVDIKVN